MWVLGQLALWFFIVQLQNLMKLLGFHSLWGQTVSAAIVVAKSVRMISPEVMKHPVSKPKSCSWAPQGICHAPKPGDGSWWKGNVAG